MSHRGAFKRVEESEDYLVDVLQRLVAVDTSVQPGDSYAQPIERVGRINALFGFR